MWSFCSHSCPLPCAEWIFFFMLFFYYIGNSLSCAKCILCFHHVSIITHSDHRTKHHPIQWIKHVYILKKRDVYFVIIKRYIVHHPVLKKKKSSSSRWYTKMLNKHWKKDSQTNIKAGLVNTPSYQNITKAGAWPSNPNSEKTLGVTPRLKRGPKEKKKLQEREKKKVISPRLPW